MKLAYRTDYQPPIPVLSVRLYSPVTDRHSGPMLAILDTGSDASIVPWRYLHQIGAEETAPGWLVTVTGERQAVALYFVDMHLDHEVAPGMRVIADENGEDVILGRDFLNRFPILLDGPIQQVTVLDDAVLEPIFDRQAHLVRS